MSNISIIFYSLVFVIIWALFIAEQLTTWGNQAVVAGEMVGVEAFLYGHLNLIVGFIFLVFIIAVGSVGSNN